jgi:hypothetical protein
MAAAFRVGINTFRTLNDPLSGELCVVGGSPRHRGARKFHHQAKSPSPKSTAGSDDGSGPTAGESAHDSTAHAADCKPCTDSAGGSGNGTKRAPEKGVEQWVPILEFPEKELRPVEPLPHDGLRFVQAVNEEVQMVGIAKGLLTADDIKVKQRVFEQLMEMAYGKNARGGEKSKPTVIDIPGMTKD